MSKETDEKPSNAGLKVVGPLGQASLSDVVIGDVGPRRSEWLPDVLEELLPRTSQTVRDLAWEFDPRTVTENRNWGAFQRQCLLDDVVDESGSLCLEADANAELEEYMGALTRYAIDYEVREPDIEEWSRADREKRNGDLETITTVGTGRGSFNAGLEVLEEGFARVHREASIAPTVLLLLDGDAWINADDNRTIERALEALDVLSEVLDVRLVTSPPVISYLERHFPEWTDRVAGLTEEGDSSGVPAPVTDEAHEEDLLVDAWDRLRELDDQGGRVRLLANLREDDAREVRDLRQDDEIGLASGTIGRYVGDLEALDFVDVDDSGRYNRLSLTPLGDAALEFISDDYAIRHPLQSRIDAPYADPPSTNKYSVTPENGMAPRDGRETADGTDSPATAEEWLAATGDPDDGAPWVQWIDGGPSKTMDAWAMHDRLRAGHRVDGVNLVDHEIEELEDGRVAYLSDFEDHVQVVVQWGGSLPTLGRLTSTLLSDRAFSKILEPSAVGSEFSNLFKGMIEEDVEAVIQRGMQLGWFSEDELQFDSFRERWGFIRSELLARLAKAQSSDDVDLRRELYQDLHGLLASATALYRAIGKETTFHVRMPDTAMLKDDDARYNDFLRFMAETVPKQTAYGVHSGYRMLLEDDPEKLRRRLSYDVQENDPVMDLTATWVVTGPQASLLQEDLEAAISSNHDDVRDQILEGNETAPAMEIPVVATNEFGAIKHEISRHLERKGFRLRHEDIVPLTRACMAILGTQTRGASPFDVAFAMLHLKKQAGIPLSVGQFENVLAKLPADRLVRSEKATVRKMFKALLEADEPMGRSDLIDAAEISTNSYDRNWRDLLELEAFGLVDRDDDKQWRGRLIPFWSDVGDTSPPEDIDGPTPSNWRDMLFDAVFELGVDDVDVDDLFSWPQDLDEILEATDWQRWRPMLEYLDDDLFENRKQASVRGLGKTGVGRPSKTPDDGVGGASKTAMDVAIATIGRRPAGADDEQRSLLNDDLVDVTVEPDSSEQAAD